MINAAPITRELTQSFTENYLTNAHYRAMANALTRNNISAIACNHASLQDTNYKFSINIKTLPTTNQYSTGRCWLFAGLNVMREIIAKKHNLEKFELSQNYTAFWDKYEKVNYFLESVIDLIDRPVDDRHMTWLLSTGIQDAGQWDMFVNVVKKYGIAPKDAMADTFQSNNTWQMNNLLNLFVFYLSNECIYFSCECIFGSGADLFFGNFSVFEKQNSRNISYSVFVADVGVVIDIYFAYNNFSVVFVR